MPICKTEREREREKNDAVDAVDGAIWIEDDGDPSLWTGFWWVFSASTSAVSSRFMIADGFSAACGPGARAYFVAFWAFGVLVGLNLFLSTIIEAFTTEYEELEEADFRLPDFSEATALSNALYVDVKQSLQIPLDDTDPTHEPLPSYRSSDGP